VEFFSKLFDKKPSAMDEAMGQIVRLIDDEAYQLSVYEEPFLSLAKRGSSADETPGTQGRFGYDVGNPIPVNGQLGELTYLSRLVSGSGERFVFHRLGSIDTTDVYEVVTVTGREWLILYVDMYHPRRSRKAPEGLRLVESPQQFSGFPEYRPSFPYDFAAAKDAVSKGIVLGYVRRNFIDEGISKKAFQRPAQHASELKRVRQSLEAVSAGVAKQPAKAPPAVDALLKAMQQRRPTSSAEFQLPMREPTREFAAVWRAAAQHLQHHGDDTLSWLRAHLHPPFLEHLSFRMGNQLYFICLDADGAAPFTDRESDALQYIADVCDGHACRMPMRQSPGGWIAREPGWGLVSLESGRPVDPVDLITDELIEMTAWELQDFAVQIVRDQLEKDGVEIMSWQSSPDVNPSLWFVGDQGPEWVVVRAYGYPEKEPSRPANWGAIEASCSSVGTRGHFATVGIANAEDQSSGSVTPLWRGHGMAVVYKGLKD
jgi:hypothetical protein